MIVVNSLPCAECKYYKGIKQPDKTEQSEYIACSKADKGDAKELLVFKGSKASCPKFEEDE